MNNVVSLDRYRAERRAAQAQTNPWNWPFIAAMTACAAFWGVILL